jgi:hypothetical protein
MNGTVPCEIPGSLMFPAKIASWYAMIIINGMTIAPNVEQEDNGKEHSLYWSPNMGKWGCNDCKQKGDRFDMQGVCRGK